MSTTGIVIVFVVSWWLFFFMALPLGVRPPEAPEPGTVPSAPERPHLWLKALAATLLATAATFGLHWAMATGWIALLPR